MPSIWWPNQEPNKLDECFKASNFLFYSLFIGQGTIKESLFQTQSYFSIYLSVSNDLKYLLVSIIGFILASGCGSVVRVVASNS